jgi:periplasmic protein CpxP/Spy
MRTIYFRTGLLTFLLLVATVLASNAQTPGTEGASPQAAPPSQSTPSQSSPDQPSAAPSQAPQQQAPPSQAAPSQTPQSGQSSSASQSSDDNPLNLTEEQKTKLRPIIADENQQMEAVRNDSSLSMEQKVAKANQIRETASPKIKAVLTQEQLQKLAELQKARQQQQGGSSQQQSAPPSGTQKPQ